MTGLGGQDDFVIVAFIGTQTLGNFVMNQVVAASVARSIPNSRLVSVFRDDRPYKALINSSNPHVAHTVALDADPGRIFPLDWLGGAADGPDPAWREMGFHRPDLVLTPSMLDIWRCLWPAPRFRIPDTVAPALAERLAASGVDPDRWFVCTHLREQGYQWRGTMDPIRNVDPADYLPAIRHIIEDLGGQVVRLGHPGMTPLPEMAGLIDLGREADNFPVQCFATSRARFFFGTDSGPTQLAAAFHTPTASSNTLGIDMWNDGDVILLRPGEHPDGTPIDRDILEPLAPYICGGITGGYRFLSNSPDELVALAGHMHETTADCPGWRRDEGCPPATPADSLRLPLKMRNIADVMDIRYWPLR